MLFRSVSSPHTHLRLATVARQPTSTLDRIGQCDHDYIGIQLLALRGRRYTLAGYGLVQRVGGEATGIISIEKDLTCFIYPMRMRHA